MVLDPELVEKARTASVRLAQAERDALLSRADYHTAVRRLHLAGGSLREIAETLSISHQRVQQIVSSAGGTWWSRVWSTRRVGPDAVCTWCGRPPAEVAKLIAGPRVYICDACVEAGEQTLAGARPAAGPFTEVKTRGVGSRCSFCGKRAGHDRPVVSGPAGRVCRDCLQTCREILDGRAA
jgi:ClpX C4-type zinc finger